MKIALIMLAAGNSRRFGSNKLLYEIEGKPMYQHILEKLMKVAEGIGKGAETGDKSNSASGRMIAADAEIVSCQVTAVTQYEEIERAARAAGARVYYNPHPDEGISSSLQIGLKANLDADACLFTVSDQPWLSVETIEQLIWLLKNSGNGIACVSCSGKLGNPCIFTRKYYDELLSITGDRGGKSVITAHREDTAVLAVKDPWELTDMDVKGKASERI